MTRTFQGAGGVAGLLSVTHIGDGTYYPTFDASPAEAGLAQKKKEHSAASGNVGQYLGDTGAVVAHYEYSPFGEVVTSSGGKADDFVYRFSTKYLDEHTGLYYYGFRYYDPVTGRWPNRDPIGEGGGKNLFVFVRNNAFNLWDYLGLEGEPTTTWTSDRMQERLNEIGERVTDQTGPLESPSDMMDALKDTLDKANESTLSVLDDLLNSLPGQVTLEALLASLPAGIGEMLALAFGAEDIYDTTDSVYDRKKM